MPQLLALDECLGTSSGDGGLTMEGIKLAGFDLPSEKRPSSSWQALVRER